MSLRGGHYFCPFRTSDVIITVKLQTKHRPIPQTTTNRKIKFNGIIDITLTLQIKLEYSAPSMPKSTFIHEP
jgi:hypothetical protein